MQPSPSPPPPPSSVPSDLYSGLIFCAIASPSTPSSRILISPLHLKDATSLTASSHGGDDEQQKSAFETLRKQL